MGLNTRFQEVLFTDSKSTTLKHNRAYNSSQRVTGHIILSS